MEFKMRLILCITVFFLFTLSPVAAESPSVQRWLSNLRKEALSSGIRPEVFRAALKDFTPLEKVIEYDRHQPEFTLDFLTYYRRMVTDRSVAKARNKLEKHRDLLWKVSEKYGVPPAYLMAFWGMETRFGAHFGAFPVVDATATLAHDHRRSAFFRTQLMHALKILNRGDVSPAKMKGSWAGAMGNFQFIPTTYYRHAVDFDGDGKKDLWASLPDSFASAANYLANAGWHPDERWGREVLLPAGFDWTAHPPGSVYSLSKWRKLGLMTTKKTPVPVVPGMKGRLLAPAGHNGPVFLVYHNFDVILKWNRSDYYALSIGLFTDRILGRGDLEVLPPPETRPLVSRQRIKLLQKRLKSEGYDIEKIDGIMGQNTRAAVRTYQKDIGLKPDGFATQALLKRLINPSMPKISPATMPPPGRKPNS